MGLPQSHEESGEHEQDLRRNTVQRILTEAGRLGVLLDASSLEKRFARMSEDDVRYWHRRLGEDPVAIIGNMKDTEELRGMFNQPLTPQAISEATDTYRAYLLERWRRA
ncbi:MAG: hypothetical protein AAB728_04970 [Patescibacteria group bacterium]